MPVPSVYSMPHTSWKTSPASQASEHSFLRSCPRTTLRFSMSSTTSGLRRKAPEGYIQHRRKEDAEEQWCKDIPMTKTLFDAKIFQACAVSRPHTRAHTIVELADDGERARRNAEMLEDIPQEVGVNRAKVCFRKVVKAYDQRYPLTLPYFLQSAKYGYYINGRASRPEAALLFWQHPFGLAVAVQAANDDLEKCFTGMGDEEGAPIL